jgi:hypothetical protein
MDQADKRKSKKYALFHKLILKRLPEWTGEVLTFTVGIRGSMKEVVWQRNLSQLGIPSTQHEEILKDTIGKAIHGLDRIFSTRSARLRDLTAESTSKCAQGGLVIQLAAPQHSPPDLAKTERESKDREERERAGEKLDQKLESKSALRQRVIREARQARESARTAQNPLQQERGGVIGVGTQGARVEGLVRTEKRSRELDSDSSDRPRKQRAVDTEQQARRSTHPATPTTSAPDPSKARLNHRAVASSQPSSRKREREQSTAEDDRHRPKGRPRAEAPQTTPQAHGDGGKKSPRQGLG